MGIDLELLICSAGINRSIRKYFLYQLRTNSCEKVYHDFQMSESEVDKGNTFELNDLFLPSKSRHTHPRLTAFRATFKMSPFHSYLMAAPALSCHIFYGKSARRIKFQWPIETSWASPSPTFASFFSRKDGPIGIPCSDPNQHQCLHATGQTICDNKSPPVGLMAAF